jgi:hypothetical protein
MLYGIPLWRETTSLSATFPDKDTTLSRYGWTMLLMEGGGCASFPWKRQG